MVKIKGLLFLFVIPLVWAFTSTHQSTGAVDTNAKVKALFIYNFSKYVEWPEKMRVGSFKIGVVGEYPALMQELNKMASTKKTGGDQSFEIVQYKSASNIGSCHILYIEPNHSSNLGDIISQINNHSTLLVTDKAGLAKQGAGINFYYQESKQKMEINKSNVEKYNLKVSSQLLAISTLVN